MFEEFIDSLRRELANLGLSEEEIYREVAEYTQKYDSLRANGMSDIEIILRFGDPKELAHKICGLEYSAQDRLENNMLSDDEQKKNEKEQKYAKKMSSVYLNDALFYTPGIVIGGLGTLAMAFMTALIGIVSAYYCYKVWVDEIFKTTEAKILGFCTALAGLVICALGCYLTYVIIRKIYDGSKRYFDDRKETVEFIKKNGTDNQKSDK